MEDNPRFSQNARELISDPAASLAIGIVSLWEIAIRHGLGRGGQEAMPVNARPPSS